MQSSSPLSPVDKVFIKMPKPLNDEIITTGGIKFYIAPDYNPSFHATVTGTVYSLPTNPRSDDFDVVSKLKVGDEIAFNYQVVINKKYKPSSEKFEPIVNLPRKRIFENSKKHKIIMNGLPYNKNVIWTGILLDSRGERLDGIQGNESEVERWLAQFDFSKDVFFVYKNNIHWGGEDIWQSDYGFIYAKKTKHGIESLGDRVIMKPIIMDVTDKAKLSGVIIPDFGKAIAEYTDRGKVVSGGERLGIKKGDTVFFDRLYLEKYNFFGKDYLIIKEKRVHGII